MTKEQYQAIKKLYDKAVEADDKSFKYEGAEILTAYAKYLLEHYETENPDDTTRNNRSTR